MILASASPRRKELLERAGIALSIQPADIDERRLPKEAPVSLVKRLAHSKAQSALEGIGALPQGEMILAADTIVWCGDAVYGKPSDQDDARRMLHELSHKTHHVSTGVCIIAWDAAETPQCTTFVETTHVRFRALSDAEIDEYVASGEPLDKAGAYGIQGGAGKFVEQLDGDYDNVVGLPVTRVVQTIGALKGSKAQSVTQIPGILAAHITKADAGTGCTVIVCPHGATGGVDVRGGAPATRETDLLRPEETVSQLHAVVLSGGSAYGLAASCGAADELERQGVGLDVGVGIVPIVSSACLFDLGVGSSTVRPTAQDGADAVRQAFDERDRRAQDRTPLARGNVGAGTGCSVGKLGGPTRAMKAGIGEAVVSAGELVCGAVAAVNACGDVVDPVSGQTLAGLLDEAGSSLISSVDALRSLAYAMPLRTAAPPRTNTTISCVVTNARLDKAQATKVAQMAADAYAHAISPTHTTNDGDTVFVMATDLVDQPTDVVGTLATFALEQAIADAATQTHGAYGLKASRDLSSR